MAKLTPSFSKADGGNTPEPNGGKELEDLDEIPKN